MRLLRLLSWPYVRKHVLRTALTTAGIVLGVSVFVGMRAASHAVLEAFTHTIDRVAGKTELQITAGDTGFGEDVLERVQAVKGVRVAVPVIEAVVDSNIPGQGNLFVLGVDMTGDRSLRDYDFENGDESVMDDPLIFLAQLDSIILTNEFAARNKLGVGDTLRLGTVEGDVRFTVRGVMRSAGLATAFGGNIAVMDVFAAQKMFGRGRTFDRIDLAATPGVQLTEVQGRLNAALGDAFQVQPPATRGQQFEAVLAGYSTMVGISSAFALFIGMFIIYNAFSTAVAQRRAEIGILRALGATREQIRGLFLTEGALIGVAGSLVGVALGVGLADTVTASISALIADVYGTSQRVDGVAMSPWLMVAAVAVGATTSVIAAAVPAHQAASTDPVVALQPGRYQRFSEATGRARLWLAALCGVLGAGALVAAHARPLFYMGYVLTIACIVLLVPQLSRFLLWGLRPVMQWVRPVEGVLAADSLLHAQRRTSACITALTLSLALVVAFAGIARSSYDSIVEWMEVTFNPDLFVTPSQGLELQAPRLPAVMRDEIAALPGVARVQTFRRGRITFQGRPAMILANDMQSVSETAPRAPVSGDAGQMYAAAAAGRGVVVSDNLAQLHRLRMGDMVEVRAPYGLLRLPIAGIIVDYSDQQGSIFVDRSVFLRYWRDDSVTDYRVYANPGQVEAVRERIRARYEGRRHLFVLANADLKAYILKNTNAWFDLTFIPVAVAVLVAVLGVVNALTVSITDRRRELGVLQAIGGLRGQIRKTVWMEALGVAILGLALGACLGAVNLYYVLDIVRKDVVGMHLDYVFPTVAMASLVPVILGAAFLAALWPAESAVRGSLVEALEYE